MRRKSPEKRGRQKVVRPPIYRIENEYNPEAMPQYFQSFVFELCTSIRDIQQSSLWLAVMEPRCYAPPSLLGEASIGLGTVWIQPHHQVFHKWVQLSNLQNQTRALTAGPAGFLQVDISIIFRAETHITSLLETNRKMDDNLLLPSGSEQQLANYLITIYQAFGISSGSQPQGDKRSGKPPSTFVRVSFCGLVAKTATVRRSVNPVFCEKLSIVEMFPNMSQFIRFEVCSAEGCFIRVLACAYLNLGQISHDGENGFLPTFGPSLLHMYGTSIGSLGVNEGSFGINEDGPYHRGTLLIALNTIVPFYQQTLRSITKEPVAPMKPENLWLMEDFCIFCPIFEVSLLDREIAGAFCGVAITMSEIPSDNLAEDEFQYMMNETRAHKMHYTGCLKVVDYQPVYGYLFFCNAFPVLQIATRLPDFRFRMYRNNMIHGIAANLISLQIDQLPSVIDKVLNILSLICIATILVITARALTIIKKRRNFPIQRNIAIDEVKHRLKKLDYIALNDLLDKLNKALDDTSGHIVKFLDIVQYSNPDSSDGEDISMMRQYNTELDLKQLALQKEEIEKIQEQISFKLKNRPKLKLVSSSTCEIDVRDITKKTIKCFLKELQNLVQNLNNIVHKSYQGWPDIVVWLLNEGSRVAYMKISAADVIHSVIPEQSGKDCGRIQTVYMKPLVCPKHVNCISSCHCIAGKVELLLWMGLYRQRSAFESSLPSGYHLNVKAFNMCIKCSTMMVECRACIYKAKLFSNINGIDSLQTFVRINVMNSIIETKVKCKTLSPVWNQVLKMNKMVHMTSERLFNNPPIVLVEVNNTDLSGEIELIGRCEVHPMVNDNADSELAPKLEWYDLYKGTECTGVVLLSVQLLYIPEKVLKTTTYGSVEQCYVASALSCKEVNVPGNQETLPTNPLPKFTSYKIDVYWWGLRSLNVSKKPGVILEIEDVAIKSRVIANKQANCNFFDGRMSEIFEAPLHDTCYNPLLNIKLFDSSSFGRTLYLGTKSVKNPTKYIVSWQPKEQRDASLSRASITSSDFIQVNQMLFIKKFSQFKHANDYGSNNYIKRSSGNCKVERRKWPKCCYKEPEEEECSLLPILNSNKHTLSRTALSDDESDWWLKYLRSNKDFIDEDNVSAADKITIYDSELESQPEFSKFRDWCSSLKLYNGKKTDLENDKQCLCGILKAGIAIYRWPPSGKMVAVTESGADLNKGYFHDHPCNDPASFLVRVYLVKGFNLKTKDYFTGKLDPYVILNCGKKQLGNRCNYVANTLNPLFGRMYEFKCKLPEEYLLIISLYNYEQSQPDKFLGCTNIDLEDRIYSKHRARVGLPYEYSSNEKYNWRDCIKPSAILEELCSINHLPPPLFFSDTITVMVNGVEYKDTEREITLSSASERKQNLCLGILRKWHTIPICGYHLVPEHVETRTLYNPEKPGTDHGKLHMWVDIFPLDTDASIPRPIDITPRKLEEYQLRLTVYSVRAFDSQANYPRSTDLYVRAYLGSENESQRTDVHYQMVAGECNFNWRMIFNFYYQTTMQKLIRKEKGVFTEYEDSIPPILIVLLMDNEATCLDDNLGSLMLNLNAIPTGVKHVNQCTLEILENHKKINLFSTRNLRAWWPLSFIDQDSGRTLLAGKIDLEICLLPLQSAILMPVGIGREPPFPLPEPKRRDSRQIYYKLQNILHQIPSQFIWVVVLCTLTLLLLFLAMQYHLPAVLYYWVVL